MLKFAKTRRFAMMNIRLLSLLLGGLMVAQCCNAEALPEAISSNADHKGSGQVAESSKQLQSPGHHIISCYACSTMDYENPADNPCRFMPKHIHRAPLAATVALGHASSMMNYSPSPNPTSIASTAAPYTSSLTSSSSSSSSSGSQISSSNSIPSSSDVAPAQDSGYYYGDSASGLAPTLATTALAVNSTTMMTAQRLNSGTVAHRNSPPGNSIRTRTCSDDENFCSIVSVVRIEFLNDTLVSRFWAMERNCSKSCNTGCMLIGERVRLRVCSHCCRTPNCNIGSGASTLLSPLFVLLGSAAALWLSRFH